MDQNQFKMFLEHQTKLLTQLMQGVNSQTNHPPASQPSASNILVPQPSPLSIVGDMQDNFDFFEKSWKDYATAVGMDRWPSTENEQKVSFLLSVIGEGARKKYFNFELTTAERANPEVALAAIKAKVVTKRNVVIDRLDFFTTDQLSNESVDDFIARLKYFAKLAKLGALEEELITNKVITSNKWAHLRTKMLVVEDITLDKAINMCRAEEIAAKRSQEFAVLRPESEVNKIYKQRLSSKTLRCKFCGDHHEFEKGACPAFGKRCHRCKRKNHFEKVCKKWDRRSRKVKEIKNGSRDTEDGSSAYSSSDDSEEELVIGKVFEDSDKGGTVLAELKVKLNDTWKKVPCELDTGANVSLIGYDSLSELIGVSKPELLPSKCRLRSFGGHSIDVLGQIIIPCRQNGRKYHLVLQVVNGYHCPLLSARACRELGFVKFCKTVTPSTK